MKIGFIGVGNMGGAILEGLLNTNYVEKSKVYIKNSTEKSSEKVAKKYGVNFCTTTKDLVEKVELIIVGVKPYLVKDVLQQIKGNVSNKIIVSIAASVTIKDIENIVGSEKIVRAMPNTSVKVCHGVTGVVFNDLIEGEERERIVAMFESIGVCEELKENNIDALTALSGSGPAYVYSFVEGLIKGAVLNGLDQKSAKTIAINTVIGAMKMLEKSDEHPAKLRDDVCSPAGSTIEAVRVLEKLNFQSAIIESERACFEKLQKMNK